MNKKSESKEHDLGIRKVSNMNFSKIVTLPKEFTQSLDENRLVRLSLENGVLKLRPVIYDKDDGET